MSIKTMVAGLAAGVVFNLGLILLFHGVGFGWRGGGILLDTPPQSAKLVAVWTRMEPLPLLVTHPIGAALALTGFGVANARLYESVRRSWPPGRQTRAGRLSLIIFLTFLFWEFFTPFNLFGEPIRLIAVELLFWAVIACAEAITIVLIVERKGAA